GVAARGSRHRGPARRSCSEHGEKDRPGSNRVGEKVRRATSGGTTPREDEECGHKNRGRIGACGKRDQGQVLELGVTSGSIISRLLAESEKSSSGPRSGCRQVA